MHCFDVEARVEENRGSHNAGARGGPLATTQEHCEGDDDAVVTGCGIHVKQPKRSATVAGNLIAHDLQHDGSKGVAAMTASPLVVMKTLLCFGLLNSSASDDQSFEPIEIRLEEVDGS